MQKKYLFSIILVIVVAILLLVYKTISNDALKPKEVPLLDFMSIDTMKYSRDLAREKEQDTAFDKDIETQVKNIAETGATHVAIATPYDEEFLPFLQKWVLFARKYNLNVWFRGNWSGWEGWFDYPKISREEHIEKTKNFISSHRSLFKDGDVFTACPECENGGPGDPRVTGDIEGYRSFLIDEYQMTKQTFNEIGKDIKSNYASMNGDVARVVMDKETTAKLDGIVTIDHYVYSIDKFISDVKEIAKTSGGKIVIGEFGAPIPDINGDMTEEEQANWVKDIMNRIAQTKEIIGVNYWANLGSSTALWNDDNTPKAAVSELSFFYKLRILKYVK